LLPLSGRSDQAICEIASVTLVVTATCSAGAPSSAAPSRRACSRAPASVGSSNQVVPYRPSWRRNFSSSAMALRGMSPIEAVFM
jgi:hypothetical protein